MSGKILMILSLAKDGATVTKNVANVVVNDSEDVDVGADVDENATVQPQTIVR